MTELLLTQQLESPSGTGRVDPEVTSDSQAPHQTNGMPTSQPPHSHWQIWRPKPGTSDALGRKQPREDGARVSGDTFLSQGHVVSMSLRAAAVNASRPGGRRRRLDQTTAVSTGARSVTEMKARPAPVTVGTIEPGTKQAAAPVATVSKVSSGP